MLKLVRHGEPKDKNLILGQLDPPLSQMLRQKQIQNSTYFEHGVKVISSPLKRAKETAYLFGYDDPIIDHRVAEMDLGIFQGQPASKENLSKIRQLYLRPEDRSHGGESLSMFCSRIEAFLHHYKDQNIVVFTHAGVIRAIINRILSINDMDFVPDYLDIVEINDLGSRSYDVTKILFAQA